MVLRLERHQCNKEDPGTPSRPCPVSNLDQGGPRVLELGRVNPPGIKNSKLVRRRVERVRSLLASGTQLLEICRARVHRDLATLVGPKQVPNALAVINVAPVVLKVSWNFYV